MGLFGKKDKDAEQTSEKEVVSTPAKKVVTPVLTADRDIAAVIKRPYITEKAALAIDKNVYTFEIHSDASKYDVRDAIKKIYDVTPVKVHIVNKKPRHTLSRMRGRSVTESGLKKAYVYLKEGDRIDLV